ncbi:MAG: hypothetical protein KGI58_00300 [Patescibacteria group bacterium]|nr:hypothetical protein [Patescibacteria group bacterium]
MKNKNLILIAIILIAITDVGCVTTKPAQQLPQLTQVAPQEANKPILWMQQYFTNFPLKLIKDTISLYPTDTVKFRGPSQFAFVGGHVQQVDTIVIVNPMTPGKIVGNPKYAGNRVVGFDVLFEKNSPFPVPFIVNQDASFSPEGFPLVKLVWYLERFSVTRTLSGNEVN